ncbi:acid phosphatase type 7-like isoform X2 [Littorina saxatilis]
MKPFLATFATLLLVFGTTRVSTHDLVGGGCLLARFPDDLLQQLKQESNFLYPPSPPSHAPVQGLHLALEGSEGLRVTWMNPARPSIGGKFYPQCMFGPEGSNLSHVVSAHFYTYTAGMFAHVLNTAVLDLSVIPCVNKTSSPCVKALAYQCGDKAFGFGDVLHANIQDKVVPLTPGPQFAVIGDMGVPHGLKTIDSIASRMSGGGLGEVEMLLHAGDITYANHYGTKTHNNSYVWVEYMNALQSVVGKVPYMTAPGNHEAQFEFAAYLNWLPMPNKASSSDSPFWFSFDYLGVHVLSFSTEHDFTPNSTQHRWIEQDLKRANGNRARVPWLVVIGHRPLYCSSLICWERCHDEATTFRSNLEELLYQYRVDAMITGHNHQYERSYPVYLGKATQKNYINPQAPVYIVDGAAGNPELNDPTFEPGVEWRGNDEPSMATGFLLMTPSQSQLKFDYVLSDTDKVFDSFTIVRK